MAVIRATEGMKYCRAHGAGLAGHNAQSHMTESALCAVRLSAILCTVVLLWPYIRQYTSLTQEWCRAIQ